MSAHSHFGGHALWRPLLQVPRDALLDYAHQHALHWIEDPSNGDDHADRNFLRLQVRPLLRQRGPHAAAALAGSAAHCAQTRGTARAVSAAAAADFTRPRRTRAAGLGAGP
ncbi:hypothetical protein G6F61_014166 [Rhizopus arrhizus]|nr:hypothetical protein G6F61_014166 [Rhizopus arrhizus]